MRLIADYDDLLFAGEVTGLPSASGVTRNIARRRSEGYSAALQEFDSFITSTRALAYRLQALASKAIVSVVPNGLSQRWMLQGTALYPSSPSSGSPVLRYFSGSPSHDDDFASIRDPLREALSRHPSLRIEVVGPVDLSRMNLPPDRVRPLARVHYDALAPLLASTWVSVAPLAKTEFGVCKSAIKFLESAAFGCPTLASSNDDLLRHQELGAPVILCDSADDWSAQLEGILDRDTRTRSGLDAKRHIERAGLAQHHLSAWLSALGLETQA